MIDPVILSFSGEELREFRYFLKRRNAPTQQREDLKLITLIRNGSVSESSRNVNAYHQTRKRLKKHLEQFLPLQNLKADPTSSIYNLVETSRYLFRKNLYKQAWSYAQKAEKLAIETEEYRMLDLIYHTQIGYISAISVANIEAPDVRDLVDKRDRNFSLAKTDSDANAAYALLLHEIRELFSTGLYADLSARQTDMDALVNNILSRYGLNEHIYTQPRIYCKIVNIVCRALREKKDYVNLKHYSMNNYYRMKKRKLLDKIPPDFLMELLRSIYQAAIRTRNYKLCDKFQQLYHEQVKQFKTEHDKYLYYDFRSGIMAADMHMCTGRLDEARAHLLGLDKKYASNDRSAIIYFLLRINLFALHFKYNEYSKCSTLFNGIIQKYEKKILKEEGLGLEMLLFTELFGIITYYQLDETEYAWYLLKRVKRRYAEILSDPASERENQFIRILSKIIKEPGYLKSAKFFRDHDHFAAMKQYVPGDKEYISMNAWLSSLRTGKSYYDCFLESVKA